MVPPFACRTECRDGQRGQEAITAWLRSWVLTRFEIVHLISTSAALVINWAAISGVRILSFTTIFVPSPLPLLKLAQRNGRDIVVGSAHRGCHPLSSQLIYG